MPTSKQREQEEEEESNSKLDSTKTAAASTDFGLEQSFLLWMEGVLFWIQPISLSSPNKWTKHTDCDQ